MEDTIWALLSLLKQIVSVWWFLSWQGGLCCWQILGISGRWFGTWKGKDVNNYFSLSNFHAPVLETLVVVKPVKKFPTFYVTITAAVHWTSSASKCCVQPPPYHSEIIFPIVLSSVCRYSKGSGLSLSFMTKLLCGCFVSAVIYDTKGKFLMHMFRCHVADTANSTLFFFPFVCGSH